MGLLANTIDGPERPTPLHLGTTKTSAKDRDHVRSASALSALKKSLVANLSAKRQLSVAKLSAKRIFSLAKRDFLVANGRMAADFSSPAFVQYAKVTLLEISPCQSPIVKRSGVAYSCSYALLLIVILLHCAMHSSYCDAGHFHGQPGLLVQSP